MQKLKLLVLTEHSQMLMRKKSQTLMPSHRALNTCYANFLNQLFHLKNQNSIGIFQEEKSNLEIIWQADLEKKPKTVSQVSSIKSPLKLSFLINFVHCISIFLCNQTLLHNLAKKKEDSYQKQRIVLGIASGKLMDNQPLSAVIYAYVG